jgi:hypothetical protein
MAKKKSDVINKVFSFDLNNLPTDEQIEEMFYNYKEDYRKWAYYFYKKNNQFYNEKFYKYSMILMNEPKEEKKKSSETGIWIDNIYTTLKPIVICPHCQEKGFVYTGIGKQKAGISGGKATGALLTGGLSLFATGLSRKVTVTLAYCKKCESQWQF